MECERADLALTRGIKFFEGGRIAGKSAIGSAAFFTSTEFPHHAQGGVVTMTTNGEEEDDYLTMALAEPERGPETYSQRRARKLREHETISHSKPIKELEKERRDEGMDKNLFEDRPIKETKAMRMMKMMGYQYIPLLLNID